MKSIWDEVQYATGHIGAMLARLEKLRKKLDSKKTAYKQLVTSDMGQRLLMFENEDTREVVEAMVVESVNKAYDDIERQLNQLRDLMDGKPKAKAKSPSQSFLEIFNSTFFSR